MSSGRCQRGCCWNHLGVCGKQRACACHVERYDSRTAREALEDYLDSLGEE